MTHRGQRIFCSQAFRPPRNAPRDTDEHWASPVDLLLGPRWVRAATVPHGQQRSPTVANGSEEPQVIAPPAQAAGMMQAADSDCGPEGRGVRGPSVTLLLNSGFALHLLPHAVGPWAGCQRLVNGMRRLLRGRPSGQVDTRPESCHPGPTARRSSAWRARCCWRQPQRRPRAALHHRRHRPGQALHGQRRKRAASLGGWGSRERPWTSRTTALTRRAVAAGSRSNVEAGSSDRARRVVMAFGRANSRSPSSPWTRPNPESPTPP
jgi:hypothetical protein